jgi:hypothetical protein
MIGLHGVGERVAFAQLGAWQVKRHAESAEPHAYFASRGFLHLQLWHPEAQVSILTPSRFTHGRFEIWRDWARIAVRDWGDVIRRLSDLALPTAVEINALVRWTVIRDETDARGAGPAEARDPAVGR